MGNIGYQIALKKASGNFDPVAGILTCTKIFFDAKVAKEAKIRKEKHKKTLRIFATFATFASKKFKN